MRAAESCAATMAGVLPPEMVVRVLNPIIKTGEFPVNQVISSPVSQLARERMIFLRIKKKRYPRSNLVFHLIKLVTQSYFGKLEK